ncbi:hypothetical protein OB2597_07585 [Pseudooceanicola batsensis HTCC2597]|uniref:Uncharacterized protein n=1 Tax=Pseudooceanicola batsensis (strain ATCC BAA-863 / DSM 15984 / KCTC 12145 / HTCC2597) TaxID=252305 RepID=A3TU02_PSEBH|nr:hypothetical protein [Pseudooceanicola batsensis]EAQ05129.1 hypothetical protein OB2597_07585 [Pseudooceanicola batsensis HTCC2597]
MSAAAIRPEVIAWARRWREALIGGAVGLLGLYWALTSFGILSWIGWGLLVIAAPALIVSGLQRGRFRAGGGGPGVVSVDEGQVAYFGPLTGGAVALSEVHRLSLDSRSDPPVWILEQSGQPELAVPLTAEGADALFDIFAALPGIRTDRMLEEMRAARRPHRVLIWERPATHLRLH